ncbi:MAG: molecular chaperone [Acidimicrobiia bacterium]
MTNGWAHVARLRQGLYRFFAAGLLPPDPERLVKLAAAAKLLDEAGIDAFAFAGPWKALVLSVSRLPAAEALQVEYLRLFVVGVDGALCPPVESYYVASPRGGGPAIVTGELEREYRRLGLVSTPARSTASDHVATELELMASLCGRESRAWAKGRVAEVAGILEKEHGFLRRHLGRWFPTFARGVSEKAPPGFYRTLVETAGAFLHHDQELVGLRTMHLAREGVA